MGAKQFKLARRTARRIINTAFDEGTERVKKELKKKPRFFPRWAWRLIGKLYFKFDL